MIKKNGVYVDSNDPNGILWDYNNRWDEKLLKPLIGSVEWVGYSDSEKILVPYAEKDLEGFVVENEKLITVGRLKERYDFWFSDKDVTNGKSGIIKQNI